MALGRVESEASSFGPPGEGEDWANEAQSLIFGAENDFRENSDYSSLRKKLFNIREFANKRAEVLEKETMCRGDIEPALRPGTYVCKGYDIKGNYSHLRDQFADALSTGHHSWGVRLIRDGVWTYTDLFELVPE